MTVVIGTGYYHVGAANTNREVTFSFATDGGADTFTFLKGTNAFHPWKNTATQPYSANDLIAQYRIDYLVRYVTIYAIPVKIFLSQTTDPNDTLNITFETAVGDALPFASGAAASPITDTLGMADRPAKTKPGLQTLANDCLAAATLDGVAGDLWVINAPLPDGTPSTAAAVSTITVATTDVSLYE